MRRLLFFPFILGIGPQSQAIILNGESGEIDAAVKRPINRQLYRPKGIDLFRKRRSGC